MIVKGYKKGGEGAEVHQLTKAIDSVKDYVDHIFITTTQEHIPPNTKGDITYSNFDWTDNFAEARNYNFQQAKDYKYILWIDSDDVVENPEVIPEVVEKMDEQGLDAVFCDYNYEIDKQGNVVIKHPRERIVRNGSFEWKGALHETLIAKSAPRTLWIKDFAINHYPTKENRKEGMRRNLRILTTQYNKERKEVAEGKKKEIDPRTEFYLGRVLFDMRSEESLLRASELFQDYLQHSGWDDERAQAWNYLGNIMFLGQKYDDAIICYLNATKENPMFPTWYINIGRTYAALEKFDRAEFYTKQGLTIKPPNTAVITTPRDDLINATLTMYYVFFQRRDMKKALQMAVKLFQLRPDKDSKNKVDVCEKLIKMSDQLKAVKSMVEDYHEKKQPEKITPLLESIPRELQETVYVSKVKQKFQKPKKWSDKSVVYYAASDLEAWSPKSLDKGVGGSEEAIIFLAKAWKKLGYEVTVYANVGADEGVHDGVEYLNYFRFNNNDQFNVLIGWRNPLLFKYNTFNARLTLLDMHDVPEVNDYTQEVVNRVDKIMVKSEFHKSLFKDTPFKIPDDKFVVIPNGIDIKTLSKIKGKKKRYKVFYGSSYDRGLEHLLKMWPEIKEAEPLAELHVCYGWQLFEKVHGHNPQMVKWKKMMDKMLKQEGVVHHGRVGKKQLYSIAKECGIWAYPTHFEEISCITAMYTQALGCLPVVTDYAALKETVKFGSKEPDIQSFERRMKRSIQKPVDPEFQKEMRKTIFDEYDWNNVAKEWIGVIEQPSEQDVKVSIITPTIRTGWWNVMANNIAHQSHKNLEWIIVDDYKKNRKSIADKYADKYSLDIKYIHKPKRTAKKPRKYGLSSANNQGWRASDGSICVWLQDFVLMPIDGIEKIVRLHKRYPKDIIAPTDYYHKALIKDQSNDEDWFDGNTWPVGEHLRTNARIGNRGVRPTTDTYEFELNYGAVPKSILEELNGFWEFYDDALGYDDTELPYRAFRLGSRILIDESNNAICLDHWEPLKDRPEELGEERTHNLNDPRFIWMVNKMDSGELPLVRDQKTDDNIDLKYQIPSDLDQKGAVKWMKKNLDKIIEGWK